MRAWGNSYFRNDFLKLACLIGAISGTIALFIITPSLSTPTLLSIILATLLSPLVAALERRGFSRPLAITLLLAIVGASTALFGIWIVHSGIKQWVLFKEHTVDPYHAALAKFREVELRMKLEYPFLSQTHFADTLLKWGEEGESWFVDHAPSFIAELLTWFFLVPLLTYVLLEEGRTIRKAFFLLVPNRLFESFFLITTDIISAISNYLRAKLLEALLLGTLVTLGLLLIHAPYALVLGVVAGIANVVPYLGPIIGAVPGILIMIYDPSLNHFSIPVTLVYFLANLIDSLLIFPIVVAKLIRLHPLLLVAVVAVGQQYYGFVGMLISVPIAAALKVIFLEIYSAIYQQRIQRTGSAANFIHFRK